MSFFGVSYHSPKVEIREAAPGKGVGLFAREAIEPGEVLVITGGRILTAEQFRVFPNEHLPFQVELDLHIAPIEVWRREGIFAVNHSCEPNAVIGGQSGLVAWKPIVRGDEITYDYATTDSDTGVVPAFSMRCLCGSSGCRGQISDRDWRRPEIREKYRGVFAPYLAARIAGES